MALITHSTSSISGDYSRLALIPGNCLFSDTASLRHDDKTLFFMAEDEGLCRQFTYHKHKLILLLSAMRSYRDWLSEKVDLVYYGVDDKRDQDYGEKLLCTLKKYNIQSIITYDFESHGLKSVISNLCRKNGIILETVSSPGFMTLIDEFNSYRGDRDKLLMNNFYIHQRKKLGILLDDNGKPVGGKWNLDSQNRNPLPALMHVPHIAGNQRTSHTENLINIVDRIFPSGPGRSSDFYLPTTRKDAFSWLDDFVEKRLGSFGPYEDAIRKDGSFLFHSVLSPLINIGLLTPDEVIGRALEHYEMNSDTIPLSSIEGFVRQIIGWREFMRCMYHSSDLKGNFFGHHRKMDDRWYTGELGIEPVDDVIHKVIENGYCHHIERLMVLGNFMLLCEIDPDEVYKWFMEMFADSYEWVMVPNVYGMSQFADGGTLSTKPYVSGSRYILKMSDYKKGRWCEIWDALYWRFISRNMDVLKNNFRMGMMVSAYDRMSDEKKERSSFIAEEFLGSL